MSDLKIIRDRLRDFDKIERLLESIGCEYIKEEQRGSLITAQLPEKYNSPNKRSVQVKMNTSLSSVIRSRGDFSGGSIFDLISYIHFDKRGEEELTKSLYKAKEYICGLFGWNEFMKGDKGGVAVKDYTASLKEILGEKKKKREIIPNEILSEDILQDFYPYGSPLPYSGWIEEGISYRTQALYGVGFDLESKRVVFPLRNRFGELIGVKGRVMKTKDDPERKYLYLYRCNNRYEWFNFWNAQPYILTENRVYIMESEKSCMKAYDFGVFNTLAIGASDISFEQADIIKNLGLDVEIVLCYDKDKTTDEISKQAEVFEGRKVYGMFDIDDVLDGEKSSPVDEGIEKWKYLQENSIFEIKP